MDVKELRKIANDCESILRSKDINKINIAINELLKIEDELLKTPYIIYYFLGNLYSEKSLLLKETTGGWRDDNYPINRVKAVNYLRQSIDAFGEKIPNFLDIKTNLGNELSKFCRVIESNELWTFDYDGIIGDSKFVAPYSRAKNIYWLLPFINDPGHQQEYAYFSYFLLANLRNDVNNIAHPNIKISLKNDPQVLYILEQGDKVKDSFIQFSKESFGIKYSKEEEDYRKWCLENTLFLNDLNDITNEWIAAQDILQFPDYIVKIGEGPFYSAAFSDIKRTYCFARHLAFKGFFDICSKYEEKDLYLTDTLNYVDYSGSTENLKTALRLSYSILDRLAKLMEKYFDIKSKKKVTFSSLWIKENRKDICNPFIDALYWLSCDLQDTSNIKKEWKAPNPKSSHLRKIRNSIEHNWLRVTLYDSTATIWDEKNDYAHTITKGELENATLEMFKYTRNAILYFTFAVKFNEDNKEIKDALIASMPITTWQN